MPGRLAGRKYAVTAFLLVAAGSALMAGQAAAQSDTFGVVAPYVVAVLQSYGGRVSRGSGWVAADGRVLTAAHVIQQSSAPVLVVREQGPLTPERGRWARVVQVERERDVAVLDAGLPRQGLPLVEVLPGAGEEVWVFGYEFVGQAGVLRMGRASVGQRFADFFQVDGPIQPGFSGGPVTTRGGRVAGMVSFGLGRNPNLAYMVPAHVLAAFAPAARPEPVTGEPRRGQHPGYFVLANRLGEWFTEPEQRMSFYAAVADGVAMVSAVDRTPLARRFSGCAPEPDMPGQIPFLTPSWYEYGPIGLARLVVEQVLRTCPGPGRDVVTDPLVRVGLLDSALRSRTYRQDGHLMLVGAHDALVALYDLEATPGQLVRGFAACAQRIQTVEELVAAYRNRTELLNPSDPGVPAVVLGVLRACLGR